MSLDLRAIVQAAEDKLLGHEFAHELLASCGPAKKTGADQYETTCPSCQSHNLAYTTSKTNFARCWKCGLVLGWYTAALQFGIARDWVDYARLVCEKTGIPLELDPETEKRYRAEAKQADVLEAAFAWMRERMFDPQGGEVLQYLFDRGYCGEEITGMGLGAYTGTLDLLNHLTRAGISQDEARAAGLLTSTADGAFGSSHIMAIPWRDAIGRPVGLTVRSLETDPKRKYLHSSGLRVTEHLFNLHAVRGQALVTVCEGPIDALLLTHYGIPAVACAGTSLSKTAIEALVRAGCQALVLAMDSDSAGRNGTRRIIPEAQKAGLTVHVACLPLKDPDEALRADGVDALKGYLAAALSAAGWQGRDCILGVDMKLSTQRDPALARAAKIYSGLLERDPIGAADFADAVVEASGLDPAGVKARLTGRIESVDELALYREHVESIEKLISRQVDDIEAAFDGRKPMPRVITTGFAPLDSVLGGGWTEETLTFLMAPEKTGKTKLAIYSACMAARAGYRVGFVSLDMGAPLFASYIGVTMAVLNGDAHLESRHLRTPENTEFGRARLQAFKASAQANAGRIYTVTNGPNTLAAIAEYADYGFTVLGWDMMITDQLQRVHEFMLGQDKDRGLLARTVDCFTQFKTKYRKPQIVLHQIGRGGHDFPRRRDAYETSAPAMQADVIIMAWDEQKVRCEDPANRGFILDPPVSSDGVIQHSAPRHEWRARAPRKRASKGLVADPDYEIQTSPFNPRVIELYVEGRVEQTKFGFPFDYRQGVAL